MKAKFITLVLAIFVLAFGTSFGQEVEISIENITGAMWHNQPDSIIAGSTYVFNLRMTNNAGVAFGGFTTNFNVYSPDGATWTTTSGDSTGAMNASHMGGGIFIAYPSPATGSVSDTVTYGGFNIFGPGLPIGYNEIPFTLTIGPITDDSTMHGKHICIDSISYPQNKWAWVETGVGNHFPAWDGPHCFTIVHELTDVEDGSLVPHSFALEQNYPNPFNPSTTINFSLATRSEATLSIYNITGQLVKEYSDTYDAGMNEINWDASNVSSGVYFYKIVAGDFTDTKKMMLLK